LTEKKQVGSIATSTVQLDLAPSDFIWFGSLKRHLGVTQSLIKIHKFEW